MDRLRMAVTFWSPENVEYSENLVGAAEVAFSLYVDLTRKMAEGLSLEILQRAFKGKGVKLNHRNTTYMPRTWKPFPGHRKCTVAPYPSGNGTALRKLRS